MTKVLIAFCFAAAIFSITDSRYYLKSAEVWSSQKHIENFNFAVFNDTDGISRFNFTGKLLNDLNRTLLTFDVKKKTSPASKDYDMDVSHSNVDTCNVAKGIVGNYIINFILKGLSEHSNLVINCPQRKGYFFITNFPVPSQVEDFLPKFLPRSSQNAAWLLVIAARAKVQKAGSVRLFQLKIHGLAVFD